MVKDGSPLQGEEPCKQALFCRRFFTAMMEEDNDVLTHINKLKTLVEQLDAVVAPISEDE